MGLLGFLFGKQCPVCKGKGKYQIGGKRIIRRFGTPEYTPPAQIVKCNECNGRGYV